MSSLLAAILVAGCALDEGAPASQATDSIALGVALTHARTVIPEGAIQVSPDTAGVGVEPLLEPAARIAGFSFGHDEEAVYCDPYVRCLPLGPFRGIVHVFEVRRPSSDTMVATLRMLHFTPEEISKIFEKVDEVYLAREGPDGEWRISKIVGISET